LWRSIAAKSGSGSPAIAGNDNAGTAAAPASELISLGFSSYDLSVRSPCQQTSYFFLSPIFLSTASCVCLPGCLPEGKRDHRAKRLMPRQELKGKAVLLGHHAARVRSDGDRGGRALLLIQYRNAHGASRRMKINGVGSLASARREAKAKLGDVAKGRDPLADKKKQRDARGDTLRKIVEDEYLADSDAKKLRSAREKRGTFDRYIFPTLGSRPITEIKRSPSALTWTRKMQ